MDAVLALLYRYDQLMNIGWKVAIPVGMAAVLVKAVLGMTRHL
jgi:NADH:ubiquinone oxidoreductase subunit H